MGKKLLTALAILLCAGLLVEGILFASGKIILWLGRTPFSPGARTAKVICCVGDSHTFGVGTLYQYSYPSQLKTLCDLNNPGRAYRIINAGIPGSSTRRQVDHMASVLERQKVDFVLWMTGRNNSIELKAWQNKTLLVKIVSVLEQSRFYRFCCYVLSRFCRYDNNPSFAAELDFKVKEEAYLNYYLNRALQVCKKHKATLVLLSYYNSSSPVIRSFAFRHGITYLELPPLFREALHDEESSQYLSGDSSHLNARGYKAFSEAVYTLLFLRLPQLRLAPLLSKLDPAAFCRNKAEVYAALKWQEGRANAAANNQFEKIHLGQAYMEAGETEKALQCYRQALVKSNFRSNNTITAPFISWYLLQGRYQEAYEACFWILGRNESNYTAARYKEYIEKEFSSFIRAPAGKPDF